MACLHRGVEAVSGGQAMPWRVICLWEKFAFERHGVLTGTATASYTGSDFKRKFNGRIRNESATAYRPGEHSPIVRGTVCNADASGAP